VTTNATELKERSLYVAHELVQMIPLSGLEVYREIWRRNSWIYDYLPNALPEPEMTHNMQKERGSSWLQKLLEVFLNNPLGNRLEKWEMDRKIARLTREQSSSFESYFSADVCKGHIDKHGQNVVTALAVRVADSPSPCRAECDAIEAGRGQV
jgi:hypothetical protein